MQKKPFILLVNDDGIHAPGLQHLFRALAEKAEIAIIAPATEQSAVGLGITYRTPLHCEPVSWELNTPAWKVNGTPADCIRMALGVILDRKPDLIVSGINKGTNPGRVALYSGTIAGVIEGTLRHIPGIAFSCDSYQSPRYESLEKHIYPIVSYLLANPLPPGTLLNVNHPDVAQVKGFKLARQGSGYYIEDPEKRMHPDGYPYYWMSGKWSPHDEHEESDVALLEQGYLTAVPLCVTQMTHHDHVEQNRTAFSALHLRNSEK